MAGKEEAVRAEMIVKRNMCRKNAATVEKSAAVLSSGLRQQGALLHTNQAWG